MAEDLRDRLRMAICGSWSTSPTCWRAQADAVLAVLLEDPGNLPQRLVDAILDLPSTVLTDERHRDHQYAIGCPVCKGDVPAMVQAVMGVRDELMVHLAARLADAERRAEHAEGEHQVTRERLDQARRERDEARAERDRLRARVTGVAIHANRLETRIAPGTPAWAALADLRAALDGGE